MKTSKLFWLPIGFLVCDIGLRLYILWLNGTGATDLPNSFIVRKGIKYPEIQRLMIFTNLFVLLWTIYVRKTKYQLYKFWLLTVILYFILIFILMDKYSLNVVGYYLGINILVLNNIVANEQRENKGLV